MKPLLILPYYIHWHYGEGLKSSIRIIKNFVWFSFHLFSVGLLLKTLFMPWQRVQETRTGMKDIAGTIVINLLTRMAGAIIRLVVISAGLIFSAVILAGGIVFVVIWLAFPVFILASLVLGIVLLFT